MSTAAGRGPDEPRADILIVDDRPENLLALEVTLAGLGQEIVKAGGGREALGILLRREFAVILLDVRMPDMDGFETAGYIRKSRRSMHTPILFITAGDPQDAQRSRGYSVGAVDYIQKPIDPDILRSKVRVFLDFYLSGKKLARQAEQIARANAELRRAYRELGVVAYTVAHDLRAPLRTMAGFSHILREEYAGKTLDQTALDHASRIEAGARQMDALIKSLLAYCRVAGSSVELERLDPEELVRGVIDQAARGRDGRTDISVCKTLPAVLGHREFLTQTLAILVSNALKFTGGRPPHVRIRSEDRGERLRIWVEDDGIGIAPEHHARIFQTFERLQPDEFDGMGMGLAIAKASMERMGGQIGLESAPGAGSRFWIELPLWKECPVPAPA